MKNTKTFQNLMNAFAGESQARNRYEMYAKIAKKEGYSNISNVFMETAGNEYYHAKTFYQLLVDMVGEDNLPETMVVNGTYPIAKKTTLDNLLYAAAGEAEEVGLYGEFAAIAKEEGFMEASAKFNFIAKVEGHHSERYAALASLIKIDQLLAKEESVEWRCQACGHVHTGSKAPGKCPVCGESAGHFEVYTKEVF